MERLQAEEARLNNLEQRWAASQKRLRVEAHHERTTNTLQKRRMEAFRLEQLQRNEGKALTRGGRRRQLRDSPRGRPVD